MDQIPEKKLKKKSKSAGKAEPAVIVKKKLQPESIRVDLFGDLLKFTRKSLDIQAPFRKYDAYAMALAEEPREERLLVYHFFCGVALTSHARRIKDHAVRKEVFELKNALYLAVANTFQYRRMLNFRLCMNRRFKVIKYCDECTARNTEQKLDPRAWKFCQSCTVDRNYFNVLSMFHKYNEGGASLFLGNDMLHEVKALKEIRRVKFGALNEEITFRKFIFSARNLVAMDLKSLLAVGKKLLDLDQKFALANPEPPFFRDYVPEKGAYYLQSQFSDRPYSGKPSFGGQGRSFDNRPQGGRPQGRSFGGSQQGQQRPFAPEPRTGIQLPGVAKPIVMPTAHTHPEEPRTGIQMPGVAKPAAMPMAQAHPEEPRTGIVLAAPGSVPARAPKITDDSASRFHDESIKNEPRTGIVLKPKV